MKTTTSPPQDAGQQTNKWRRRFWLAIFAWMLTSVLMSFPEVRGVVAYPLYAHDENASGEVAYVMADGPAYWERLRAASDLYHMERVNRIVVLNETRSDGYNFILKKSNTRFERSIAYLGLFGVPANAIESIPEVTNAKMGSMSEANSFANTFPETKNIVVVTSAPHTRRSKLCFQRAFKSNANVSVYSASKPPESSEIMGALWIEYVKLVVYFVAA